MLRLPVTWPLRYMINTDNRDLEVLAAELKQLIAQMDVRYQPQFAQAVRRLETRAQAQSPVALRSPAGAVPASQVAVAPANVPYLYFVSRNDGSHVFSQTLDEHNRNVQQYQVAARGRFKFDRKGKYSVVAGLYTGNTINSGWNNN